MHLIVGLGNPGDEYQKTRHNAGFLFLDKLREKGTFVTERKFEAEVLKTDEYLLVKPMTFMNESGRAVRKIMDYFKINFEDLIVVHDDLDIAFGEYKIQKEVGPKVHNGIKSVEQYLERKDFLRVRVGIDNRQPGVSYGTGADYVLSKFAKEEIMELGDVFEQIEKELMETVSNNG